jgi:hypothetical protein
MDRSMFSGTGELLFAVLAIPCCFRKLLSWNVFAFPCAPPKRRRTRVSSLINTDRKTRFFQKNKPTADFLARQLY